MYQKTYNAVEEKVGGANIFYQRPKKKKLLTYGYNSIGKTTLRKDTPKEIEKIAPIQIVKSISK